MHSGKKYVLMLEKLQKKLDILMLCCNVSYRGVVLDSSGSDQAKAKNIIGQKHNSEPKKFCSIIR